MTNDEMTSLSTGDLVNYRGWRMLVKSIGFRIKLNGRFQKHLPRVLDLAWPDHPEKIVYRGVLARMCKRIHPDDTLRFVEGKPPVALITVTPDGRVL